MKKMITIFILLIMLIPTFVLADTGPKPSITVHLKNIEETDYLIDLLSDFKDKNDLIDGVVPQYESLKDHEIYKYHEGNWYASALRNQILWGDIYGNKEHTHRFTYFGVPDEFKVIIELPDGTVKVSELIKKTSFNFEVELDFEDMSLNSHIISETNYLNHLGVLALTIIIEVGIAFLFKMKKYTTIAIVNLLTNVWLQVLMAKVSVISSSILWFVVLEAGIICAEGIIYLDTLETNKKKIFIYTLVANVITALLTFIV